MTTGSSTIRSITGPGSPVRTVVVDFVAGSDGTVPECFLPEKSLAGQLVESEGIDGFPVPTAGWGAHIVDEDGSLSLFISEDRPPIVIVNGNTKPGAQGTVLLRISNTPVVAVVNT